MGWAWDGVMDMHDDVDDDDDDERDDRISFLEWASYGFRWLSG